MDIKIKFLASILLLFSCKTFAESLMTKYTQKELLKNWTLSRCLGKAYDNVSVKKDADATASAYLEYSKQPIENFYILDKLADKFIKLKYTGSIPANFNTMKCIDLFYSKELNDFIDKQISPDT